MVKLPEEAELLRIFIAENDRHKGKPLYEAIVMEARERGLAGATVLRALMSFGARSRVHAAKVLRLSEDMPLVIEIVDTPEKIAEFLPDLDTMIDSGLVTLERVRVLTYRHGSEEA